jgi:hypothetical protein
MKNDVNDRVPNGTPKVLIPFYKVVNLDGVLKSSEKPRGDHAAHFKSWMERPIARSSVSK